MRYYSHVILRVGNNMGKYSHISLNFGKSMGYHSHVILNVGNNMGKYSHDIHNVGIREQAALFSQKNPSYVILGVDSVTKISQLQNSMSQFFANYWEFSHLIPNWEPKHGNISPFKSQLCDEYGTLTPVNSQL